MSCYSRNARGIFENSSVDSFFSIFLGVHEPSLGIHVSIFRDSEFSTSLKKQCAVHVPGTDVGTCYDENMESVSIFKLSLSISMSKSSNCFIPKSSWSFFEFCLEDV